MLRGLYAVAPCGSTCIFSGYFSYLPENDADIATFVKASAGVTKKPRCCISNKKKLGGFIVCAVPSIALPYSSVFMVIVNTSAL